MSVRAQSCAHRQIQRGLSVDDFGPCLLLATVNECVKPNFVRVVPADFGVATSIIRPALSLLCTS
jgi:hypothetical protein